MIDKNKMKAILMDYKGIEQISGTDIQCIPAWECLLLKKSITINKLSIKGKNEKFYTNMRKNNSKHKANCLGINAPCKELSKHLFWDISHKPLNYEQDKAFIVKRVVELGTISDWNILRQRFGIEEIAKTLMPIKNLDKKSASFISVISGTPKKLFRCFSTKQSHPKHWIS